MSISRFENRKYNSDKDETIYNLWNRYSLKIKVFNLMKRLQRQDYIENLSYEKATRKKVSKLTLSQQSYCYHHGRISDNQLSHLVVANFFPFLQEFKNFVRLWINQGNYEKSDVRSIISLEKIFFFFINILDNYKLCLIYNRLYYLIIYLIIMSSYGNFCNKTRLILVNYMFAPKWLKKL